MKSLSGLSLSALSMYAILFIALNLICTSCTKEQSHVVVASTTKVLTGTASHIDAVAAAQGSITRLEYWNIPGNDVNDLTKDLVPNAVTSIYSMEETPIRENYGAIIKGYIHPPLSGNYVFWVAADDEADVWLSADTEPAHKMLIANTLSWTNFREWTKFPSQRSKNVMLAGKMKYYFEVRHKQGGGGNNLSVQWMLPDQSLESPIPGKRLSPWLDARNSPAPANVINLDNVHDITISGKTITGENQPCINLTNAYNVHITGNTLANSSQVGIHLYKCRNITIDNNFFTKVSSGVYAEQTTAGGIKVLNNQFLNMKGPFPRGQFIQFNNVSGPDCLISRNKGENILGESYPEDAISLYQSKGTPSSPIIIEENWIRGGGPSASGGGIMLGDKGGAYLLAKNNILVDPGEFGMAIAGGDHISIVGNSIFGRSQDFTNVGLYINDIGGYQTTNCTISKNKVRFYNKTNYQNNAWIAPGTTKPAGWDDNIFGANIDAAILPQVIITKK